VRVSVKATNFVRDAIGLTPRQKGVAMIIADRVNLQTGLCTASITTIAKDAGYAERVSASRIVTELIEDVGIIVTSARSGGRVTTRYWINYEYVGVEKAKIPRSNRVQAVTVAGTSNRDRTASNRDRFPVSTVIEKGANRDRFTVQLSTGGHTKGLKDSKGVKHTQGAAEPPAAEGREGASAKVADLPAGAGASVTPETSTEKSNVNTNGNGKISGLRESQSQMRRPGETETQFIERRQRELHEHAARVERERAPRDLGVRVSEAPDAVAVAVGTPKKAARPQKRKRRARGNQFT
jgi:hypothetical protein